LLVANGAVIPLIRNPKIVQIRLEAVLGGEAGICEIAFFPVPFLEAAIVIEFQTVLDDEGDNIML
jgi:hypothetical protein